MKKEYEPSLAQKLFKDKQLITKRPEGMAIEEYRLTRYAQDQALRMILRFKPNPKVARLMPIRRGYNQHF